MSEHTHTVPASSKSRSGCSRSYATSATGSGCSWTSTISWSRGSTIPELLRTLSESMQRVVKHDSASVALVDRNTGQLRLQALTYTAGPGVVEPDIALTLDGSAAGVTFRTGIARVFRKDDLDRLFKDGPPLLPPSLQSLCCVPLVTRRGTLGTLNLASVDPDAFPATGSSSC